MKNIRLFRAAALLLTLGLAGGLGACKDYLDTVPQDFVAPETYYNNETQLTAALMGVYSALGDNGNEATYSRFLSLEAPSATDEQLARSNTVVAMSSYSADASYPNVVNCWTNLYQGINRANLLLENLDGANATAEVKNQIRGEALFLRSYYYFVLVGYWGDVPLKLSSTKSAQDVDIPRTPAAQVYDQIITDMMEAEGLLKPITAWGHNGRVSKTAAQGMLARVNLYAAGRLAQPARYAEARRWAQAVMSSGVHSLSPDYAQIFKNHCADIYDTKECLWEVEFNGNGVGTVYREIERFASSIGARNDNEAFGYQQGLYVATGTLYNSYGAGDLRRDWNISTYSYPGFDAARGKLPYPATYIWGRYINKWPREFQTAKPYSKNFGPTNWPLLRYADVLLMFAEADNEVNGSPTPAAIAAVNQVRRRGYGLPVGTVSTVADLPAAATAGKAAFFTALKAERSRELAFEGLRKLDLLRWNILLPTLKGMIPIITAQAPGSSNQPLGYYGRTATLLPYQNASDRDVLWPIPSNELSLNKAMTQNDGWK